MEGEEILRNRRVRGGQKKDRDMEGRRGKPSQRPAFQVNSYLTILVPMVAKCVCVGHLKGEFENNA